MKTSKRQRIIRWLNLFLLVINVSAFTTILFLNKQNNTFTTKTYGTSGEYQKSDNFIKKELNLNEKQFEKVSELDNNVLRSYQVILDLQCEANFEILNELSAPNPSISKLDSLATRMGRLSGALKRQTIRHFLNIRSLCDTTQKTKLRVLLKKMLEVDKECTYCNKKECSRRDQIFSNQ